MRPKAGGKYRSRPIAKATRAGAVSHAPTPPTLPRVCAAAATGASHHRAGLTAFAPIAMLCRSPETMLTSPAGTIHSSAAVPRMYAAAINGADTRTERGSVRRGSRTSPPMLLDSSSPANANAIDAHRLIPCRLPRFGTTLVGVSEFADGRPIAMNATANATMITPGTYVPIPPAFWSHLPVPTPTMLSPAASQRQTSVAGSTYVQSLASGLPPLPIAYVAITAAEISRLG